MQIQTGAVIGLRLFDVCAAIDLAVAAEELKSGAAEKRVTITHRITRRIASIFRRSALPLRLALGRRMFELEGTNVPIDLALDVYDYGTIAFIAELQLEAGTSLADARRLVRHAYDSDEVTDLARAEVERVRERLVKSARDPHDWRKAQAYTVLFLQDAPPAEVLAWDGLPALLAGDAYDGVPSPDTRADVRAHSDSHYADDLISIGSRAAVIVDPSGSRELLDLVQFALSQLLQLRFYDEELDRELATLRRDFARGRGVLGLFRAHGLLVRDASRRFVEITSFTERIDNSLKVLGDDYSARVYGKATDRLGLLLLKDSVATKQRLVADMYEVFAHEAESLRSLLLEMTIVLLIVVEIVLAFAVPGH
jgi:hypothetical protein